MAASIREPDTGTPAETPTDPSLRIPDTITTNKLPVNNVYE